MSTALEESPLTQFVQTLWKGRNHGMEDVNIGVRMPNTVIYEHNFPKGLFSTTPSCNLQRRSGKEIDSKLVVDVILTKEPPPANIKKKRGASALSRANSNYRDDQPNRQVVASYIEKKTMAVSDRDEFSVQFLTEEGLRSFLLGAVRSDNRPSTSAGPGRPSIGGDSTDHSNSNASNVETLDLALVTNKNGVLQQFINPIGDHAEQIQVLWTAHMCIAEKVRNTSFSLYDETKTPFQRASTFQGPSTYCSRAYVAPKVTELIRKNCEDLAAQIFVVEHRPVEEMTLYFATDDCERLWFLWCPYIRLAAHASHYHHAERDLIQNRHRVFGSILPEFKIPSRYCGSVLGDAALTPQNAKRKEALRITMATSFVEMTEDTLLADDPCKAQKQLVIQRQKEQQLEAQSGTNSRSAMLSSGPPRDDHPTNASSVAVSGDPVEFRYPTMDFKCLDPLPASKQTFVLPTKSRLCPKMTWLKGPLTKERPRTQMGMSRSIERSQSERSMSPLGVDYGSQAGKSRNAHSRKSPSSTGLSQKGGGGEYPIDLGSTIGSRSEAMGDAQTNRSSVHLKSQQGDLRSTPGTTPRTHHDSGNAHHSANLTDLSAIHASSNAQDEAEYERVIYSATTPNIPLRVDQLTKKPIDPMLLLIPHRGKGKNELCGAGEEVEVLRDLCRLPIHPKLYPDAQSSIEHTAGKEKDSSSTGFLRSTDSNVEQSHSESAEGGLQYVKKMQSCKQTLLLITDFLEELKEIAFGHFVLGAGTPLAFSVPVYLFPCQETAGHLVQLLKTQFQPLATMAEAIQLDEASGRNGTIDELSHHHSYKPKTHQPVTLPCFLIQNSHILRSFKSKLSQIYLVDLRNIHSLMESKYVKAKTLQQIKQKERERERERDRERTLLTNSKSAKHQSAPPGARQTVG
jgi:hypothetical protein